MGKRQRQNKQVCNHSTLQWWRVCTVSLTEADSKTHSSVTDFSRRINTNGQKVQLLRGSPIYLLMAYYPVTSSSCLLSLRWVTLKWFFFSPVSRRCGCTDGHCLSRGEKELVPIHVTTWLCWGNDKMQCSPHTSICLFWFMGFSVLLVNMQHCDLPQYWLIYP